MEKKRTPGITVVLYIAGILFLIMSAFMLATAIEYNKMYLESYGTTFAEMWSNSLQYIIMQFAPLMGIGLICIGIGKGAKLAANAGIRPAGDNQQAEKPLDSSEAGEVAPKETTEGGTDISGLVAASNNLESKIDYLTENVDATREVISIKIEEKEKRDAFRLKEMGRGLTTAFESLERKSEDPIKFEIPIAPAAVDRQIASTEDTPAAPPVFVRAKTMAMPDIPAVVKSEPAVAVTADEEKTGEAGETKTAGGVPQIFRVAQTMAMPEIPR